MIYRYSNDKIGQEYIEVEAANEKDAIEIAKKNFLSKYKVEILKICLIEG